MIFYDWKKIQKKTKGDPNNAVDIIRYLTTGAGRNWVARHNWTGTSFLLNPELLLIHAAKLPNKHIATYCALASYRSYAAYYISDIVTLDYDVYYEFRQIINSNPLLSVEDGLIHFKYEDNNQGDTDGNFI